MAQRAKSSQIEARRANSRPLTRQVSDKSRLTRLEMTRNGWKRDAPLPRQGRLGGLPRRLADGLTVISAQKLTPKCPVLGRPQQGRPRHSRRHRRRFGPGRPDSLPSRAGDRHHAPPARDGARHAAVQSIPACGFAGRVPRAFRGSGRGLGSVPVILLDTHILSVGVHRDERLPARLTAYLERQKRVTLRESAISCWEVANLVARGRPTKVS